MASLNFTGGAVDVNRLGYAARMNRLAALTLAGLTGIAALMACTDAPLVKAPPTHALAGCDAVAPGPVCRGPAKTVTVWVALAQGESVVSPTATTMPGGARVTLTAAGTIQVSGRAPLRITLDPLASSAGRQTLADGRGAYRAGHADEAVALLTQAGTTLAATDASGAALSAQVLSFVHLDAGRLEAARAALERAVPPKEDGAAVAMHAYFEALALRATGDASGALAALTRADQWTARLGLPLASVLVEARAMTHVEMGRIANAIKALRGLMIDTADACRRADLIANLGWALLASEQSAAAETGDVLDDAVQAFDRCERAPPSKRANARLNAALWRSGRGEASKPLVLPADASPELRGWARLVAARQAPTARRGSASPNSTFQAWESMATRRAW